MSTLQKHYFQDLEKNEQELLSQHCGLGIHKMHERLAMQERHMHWLIHREDDGSTTSQIFPFWDNAIMGKSLGLLVYYLQRRGMLQAAS